MRDFPILALLAGLLAACSDVPMEEQSPEEVEQIEKQLDGDARSLEEAADEAVRILEEDIEAQLREEGLGPNSAPPAE